VAIFSPSESQRFLDRPRLALTAITVDKLPHRHGRPRIKSGDGGHDDWSRPRVDKTTGDAYKLHAF
jgi:hypothetical protein